MVLSMCIAIGMECSKRWYKAVKIYKEAERVLRKIEDDFFRYVLYNGKHGLGFAGMVL